MKHVSAAACIAAAWLGFAMLSTATAHADDQAFIADLNAHGVPTINSPANMVGGGYQVCSMLRNGMSRDMAAQQFGMLNGWGPQIVDAAQHDLCPDTLR